MLRTIEQQSISPVHTLDSNGLALHHGMMLNATSNTSAMATKPLTDCKYMYMYKSYSMPGHMKKTWLADVTCCEHCC